MQPRYKKVVKAIITNNTNQSLENEVGLYKIIKDSNHLEAYGQLQYMVKGGEEELKCSDPL